MKATQVRLFLTIICWLLLSGMSKPPVPPELPSTNEPTLGHCDNFSPLKKPYFGDLHIHTSFSMDAAQFGTLNDPSDAYRFAKGERLGLPPYDLNGDATRSIQLERPLDFAAVTDHSEFLAQTNLCFNKTSLLYYGPYCTIMRGSKTGDNSIDSLAFALGLGGTMLPGGNTSLSVCELFPALCQSRLSDTWDRIQLAAQQAYDTSTDCSFTSLIGYEWTGLSLLNNQHRNVIYRNDKVSETPVSYFEESKPEGLWASLDASCKDKNNGCEVLTIPHNSNLGGGTMFQPFTEKKNPYTPELAKIRQRMEPLIEIFQHKGASECISNAHAPLASEDELCDFELVVESICTGADDDAPGCKPLCSDLIFGPIGAFSGTCVEPSDFARGMLRQGLTETARTGVNPFKMGFIASTDTHNASPGAVEEYSFKGHVGENDMSLERRINVAAAADTELAQALGDLASFATLKRYSPGGLAVVWAEQNSRNAIFDSMQNRETYATSGPRIVTRFFGGWDLPENLCQSPQFVEQAYALGVPMGGELTLPSHTPSTQPTKTNTPKFAVSALMDSGTQAHPGTQLQRIQIVKGWESQGETFEKVYDVAGSPNNGASVDTHTCTTQGEGFSSLCSVWQDPDFDPNQHAFYYARVVENPTCRWSHMQCIAAFSEQGLSCDTLVADDLEPDHPLTACCDGSIPETIQERAWTSPIWYRTLEASL